MAVDNKGFVLVTTLMMLAVMLALVGTYFTMTRVELAASKASINSINGFYAGEAGLNLRAEEVRETFLGYNRPNGNSPSTELPACEGTNIGSGDFRCKDYTIGKHKAVTFVTETPGNPRMFSIPPGERYQNLSAQEYRYAAKSVAKNIKNDVEAVLELRFKSRLVPLFQFAVFYDKDLEILPGATMTLEGPVHTNGDLYLNTEASLSINGQVTTAKALYRGRKNSNDCNSTQVKIPKNGVFTALFPSCPSRRKVNKSDVSTWNGMIQLEVDPVTVPAPEEFIPQPGATYWDKADLRLVLNLTGTNAPAIAGASTTGVSVHNQDTTINNDLTTKLHLCAGTVGGLAANASSTFYSQREKKFLKMLEIDLRAILNCIQIQQILGPSKDVGESSEGGLVFYLSVWGPHSAESSSGYGVRIRNANPISSTIALAPKPLGLTIISDQSVLTFGHYNKDNKIPAAILSDSFNILSSSFDDSKSDKLMSQRPLPVNTTINAALLSGTDTTGDKEGSSGQGGAYNGGLENYPRLHENWSAKTLTYYGSFVSLGRPQHANGRWLYGEPHYNAPIRDWHYDTMFNDAAKLPPITPRFVYLRQELFVRDYEQ
ncbi:MAG: hypothetical protein IT292_00030 [Deltaproteobacteria bacterium]|nr:hypothetical protein [Deltaproteobacteria bacterium]